VKPLNLNEKAHRCLVFKSTMPFEQKHDAFLYTYTSGRAAIIFDEISVVGFCRCNTP